MRLLIRITKPRLEIFCLSIYTLDKPRWKPSVYTNPFLSVRWLWLNVALHIWEKISEEIT